MLTIFTTCAPFEGNRAEIQRNAIHSWIESFPEIFIFGKECKNWDFSVVKNLDCDRTDFGMPSVRSMFQTAQRESSYDILCYSDCDDIHDHTLIEAAKALKNCGLKEWVATGRHWEDGRLESASAGDYFLFPKSFDWSHMPDFSGGNTPNFDTWINADCLERGIPLIDCTDAIHVVHQKHERTWSNEGARERKNIELAGNKSVGSDMATHILSMGMVIEKSKARVKIC